MNDFPFYFSLGWEHIVSIDALDHQLFILVLVNPYDFRHLKALIWLVTAFTVGHMVSLLLATFGLVHFNSFWIEILIPFTIVLSGLQNLFFAKSEDAFVRLKWVVLLLFGLVHGLGFASTLQALLGKNQNLFAPLLGFNLGLELGQLAMVVCWLSLGFVFQKALTKYPKLWSQATSIMAIAVAFYIIAGRFWEG